MNKALCSFKKPPFPWDLSPTFQKLPNWAQTGLTICLGLLFICIALCVLKKCIFKKKKNKKGERKGLKNQAVDLSPLAQADTSNNKEEDKDLLEKEEKEEANLGKLQFSLDYDFQNNNVSIWILVVLFYFFFVFFSHE